MQMSELGIRGAATSRRGGPARAWLGCLFAAVAGMIAAMAVVAPANATEHRFVGLKFTFEAPPGWGLYTIAGRPVQNPRENFHTETSLIDLKYGDYIPVAEFTRPARGAAMSPRISIFATSRGDGDTFDRAAWALDNVIALKKANTIGFDVVMQPRKFTTGTIDFLFADLIYGMNMPDGKQYGMYDQTFVIDAKTMLLIVDVTTASDDGESRSQASDLMKWFKFD